MQQRPGRGSAARRRERMLKKTMEEKDEQAKTETKMEGWLQMADRLKAEVQLLEKAVDRAVDRNSLLERRWTAEQQLRREVHAREEEKKQADETATRLQELHATTEAA